MNMGEPRAPMTCHNLGSPTRYGGNSCVSALLQFFDWKLAKRLPSIRRLPSSECFQFSGLQILFLGRFLRMQSPEMKKPCSEPVKSQTVCPLSRKMQLSRNLRSYSLSDGHEMGQAASVCTCIQKFHHGFSSSLKFRSFL